MIVGAYTLHLYCDNQPRGGASVDVCKAPAGSLWRRSPGEYTGESRTAAVAEAKRDGWRFTPWSTACFCPCCKVRPQ